MTDTREQSTTRPWWRLPLCWASLCGGRIHSDDTHLWWQCGACGKRSEAVERQWRPAR